VFSHPVYQYLQNRYDINGRSMHWEPDTEPGTRDWIELGNLLRQHPARVMIWEDTPIDPIRDKLLEMDVRTVVFSPAANTPAQDDFMAVMQQNLDALVTLQKNINE
jgi:ABC-type Zn uptake system ZnuABC Zn-binding protein ZnuA